jgi:hypothetical protein
MLLGGFMGKKLINCCRHEIKIRKPDGSFLRLAGNPNAARFVSYQEEAGTVKGIPVVVEIGGEFINLPKPQKGVVFIVSAIILERAFNRTDLVSPDMSPDSAVSLNGQTRATYVTRLRRRAQEADHGSDPTEGTVLHEE